MDDLLPILHRPPEKSLWTDGDFEKMSWHDNHVHAISLQSFDGGGRDRFLLDLDYIVEWVKPAPPDRAFSFWVCPATLVFHGATHLSADFDTGSYTLQPTLLEIQRSTPSGRGTRRWRLDGHCLQYEIDAAGYVQYLRRAPIWSPSPELPLDVRGSVCFDETAYSA
ncbi:MAG: hypothetical protein JWN46_3758 [Acidimicrobiales bacterium]|nr:hypothetical protein [Acidimicrobiales bacterium]